MDQRATYNRVTQLILILLIALGLKHLYSTTGVNELAWILAPTTFLVELVSGVTFNFESHAGYMSSDRSFLIAASCAGVNFLIAAFLMISIGRFLRQNLTWKFIPAALVISYVTTIVANTVRISTALQLQYTQLEISGLSANQLHRLEGILIYFGFLLVLFLVTERISHRSTQKTEAELQLRPGVDTNRRPYCGFGTRSRFLGQLVFPLLVYYVTTLGMPLANAFYHRNIVAAAFFEHFIFVLLAPLMLIIPLIVFQFSARLKM